MKHEIASSLASRSRKAWLLGTASALAMGVTVLCPVWAATDPIDSPYPGYPTTASTPELGVTAAGFTTLGNSSTNTETTLSALIADDSALIQGLGTNAGASTFLAANSFTASAGGNDVSNSAIGTMLLPLLPATAPTGKDGIDGVAVLNNSNNRFVLATATIANSSLGQNLVGPIGAAPVTNNTMAANVTLNQSTTTVTGSVPINYAADTTNYQGASSSVNEGSPYSATASVLATTAQFNSGSGELAGSGAMVTENTIGQFITGADGTVAVLNGSVPVTGNTLTAGFIGNSSGTALSINADGAPVFTGSTALTNLQQNFADAGSSANPAAVVKYSFVQFELDAGEPTEELPASATLGGAVTVTGNAITATATGNQAEQMPLSGATTGNVLTLAGIGLQGTSVVDSDYVESTLAGATPSIGVFGDAVVNNAQSNSSASLDAMVKQSAVIAVLPAVVGGTVTVSNNTITAQTVGNQAYNALLAPGPGSLATADQLNGVFALGSLQINQNSPLTATIVGPAGVAIATQDDVGHATLAMNANTVSASATGNSVANVVNLSASNLPSYTGLDFGFAAGTFAERNSNDTLSNDFFTNADVMLNSQQLNDVNSPVQALNQNAGVTIQAALFDGAVVSSTLSLTNNTAEALATGNASANALTLTGTNAVAASAALLGAQGSYAAVVAQLIDPTASIVASGVDDPLSSTLTLTGNVERAIAAGNFATSTLTTTGSTIAVANRGGPAAVFSYVPSLAFPIASDGLEDNQTIAGSVAHNDQAITAPVTAILTFATPGSGMAIAFGSPSGGEELPLGIPSGSMEIIVSDGLTSTTVANSSNALVAAARGNQATTQLTLTPSVSLGVVAEKEVTYSPFAVVANTQTVGDATNVQASISPDAAGPGAALPPIYTTVSGGGVSGSTLTMGGNQIQSLAEGNDATNGLTLGIVTPASGSVPSSMAPSTATVTQPGGSQPLGLLVPMLSGDDVPTATLTADAAFALQNMQVAGTGAVTATQAATGVQADITGPVANTTVTVGGATAALGNLISTAATTNTASNTLYLGASDLSASGGLVNFQVANGATSATTGALGPSTGGGTFPVDAITTNSVDGVTLGHGGTFIDNGNGTWTYSGWIVSTDAISVQDGFTQGTTGFTGNYYRQVTGLIVSSTSYGAADNFPSITLPVIPGAPTFGVLAMTLNGDVSNSTLGITQNAVNAASVANTATNIVTTTAAASSSSLSFGLEEFPPPIGFGDNPPVLFPGPGASLDPTSGAILLADVGLLNSQTLGATASSAATANGSFAISNSALAPVYTNTALSVSGNTQQASATGNTATNSLTLSPGITAAEATPLTSSILSTQTASSAVETPVTVTAGSNMLIGAPIALTGSTLALSGNANTASAVVNNVTNTLTVNGTGDLPGYNPTQTGVTQSDYTAPSVVAYGNNTLVNSQTVASGAVQSTATTAIANNDADLASVAITGTSVAADSNPTLAQSLGNHANNMLTISAEGSSGSTGAVANLQIEQADIGAAATGSTAFALNGNATNSVVEIAHNSVNATAIANTANNTVASTSASSASSVILGSLGEEMFFAGPGASLNPTTEVIADVGLLNNQSVGATGSATATASSSYGISNVAAAPVYTNATLSISGNTQMASAVGNTATNALTLSPGITPTLAQPLTASILSQQTELSLRGVPVSASSTMLIGAPMAMTGSTLTISGNTNTASAVVNDVTNALTVTGTTSLPGVNPTLQTGLLEAFLTEPAVLAYGDYTVANSQVAGGSVQSTATTTIGNNDLNLNPATISGTSVVADSNVTVAQALGNRASNTLTITAAGPSGATGGVVNNQINGALIGATATVSTIFALGQASEVANGTSTNATYAVTNNTTQALATGNQASNALNASPAAYGTATVAPGSNSRGPVAQSAATYAVLNSQYNTGPVTATVTGASPALLANFPNTGGGYIVALNTTGTGNVVNVSGNAVTSQAIGNRADNNVTLAALNTGMASTSVTSSQANSGAISASISNVQIGAAVSGGTAARVSGNSLAASAFGNIVTNSIVTH